MDSIGELHSTLRERYGRDIELKPIAAKRPFFALPRLGFSAHGVVDEVTTTIDDRALWARLGL
ncbi:hypothetical protein D3C87_2081000 [compost metagenome]